MTKDFEIIPFKDSSSIKSESGFIGVEVDVAMGNPNLEPGLCFRIPTRRNTTIYMTNFQHDAEKNILSFNVSAALPKNEYPEEFEDQMEYIGTTFSDFCWKHSEGTTPESLQEVETKVREGFRLGDLTWLLPSKFADDLVDAMYFANASVLSGIMEEAIIYGPRISTKLS